MSDCEKCKELNDYCEDCTVDVVHEERQDPMSWLSLRLWDGM